MNKTPARHRPLWEIETHLGQFEPLEHPIGYNSHGCPSTFKDIVQTEQERGNHPFTYIPDKFTQVFGDCPAIWITTDPFDAFLYNCLADEWNDDPETVKARHPGWEEEVQTIDCQGWRKLADSDDGDGGFLIVQINPSPEENTLN